MSLCKTFIKKWEAVVEKIFVPLGSYTYIATYKTPGIKFIKHIFLTAKSIEQAEKDFNKTLLTMNALNNKIRNHFQC
jgi:hypothetical protein